MFLCEQMFTMSYETMSPFIFLLSMFPTFRYGILLYLTLCLFFSIPLSPFPPSSPPSLLHAHIHAPTHACMQHYSHACVHAHVHMHTNTNTFPFFFHMLVKFMHYFYVVLVLYTFARQASLPKLSAIFCSQVCSRVHQKSPQQ